MMAIVGFRASGQPAGVRVVNGLLAARGIATRKDKIDGALGKAQRTLRRASIGLLGFVPQPNLR